MAGSDEDDFLTLLDQHLEPPHDQNRAMSNVRIVWVDDDPRLGTLHIAEHGIAKEEVEQVLFELPPVVEAKRSRENPERTLFWGATRYDRWIFIACEDWAEDSIRYLKQLLHSSLKKAKHTGDDNEQEDCPACDPYTYTPRCTRAGSIRLGCSSPVSCRI